MGEQGRLHRYTTEVVADTLQMLSVKPEAAGEVEAAEAVTASARDSIRRARARARSLDPEPIARATLPDMARQNRLVVVLALNLVLVAALILVGISSHSLGVFAEGGDYILDAAAVGAALLAMKLATRPAGYRNAPNIAALINAGWLLLLETLVAGAAVYRLAKGVPEVNGLPVLVVSGAAALAMTGGAIVLGRNPDDDDDNNDLSTKAVLLDTVADAAAAAGVAIVGGVIYLTRGWYWLDPAVALVIAAVVSFHAVGLMRRVISRLREP